MNHVHQLDSEKLKLLTDLKYGAIADLGKAEEIGGIFAGFQRFLYQKTVPPCERTGPRTGDLAELSA